MKRQRSNQHNLFSGPGTLKMPPTSTVKLGDFLFYVERLMEDQVYAVTINTKEEWQKHRRVKDHYTPEERKCLDPILKKYKLYELMESIFQVPDNGPATIPLFTAVLLSEGLEQDPAMNAWIASLGTEY